MSTKNQHRLGIGARVWRFGSSDAPVVLRIVSETSRSWILGDRQKVPKSYESDVFEVQHKYGTLNRYCLTKTAAEEVLLERSRWAIAEKVRRGSSIGELRDVAWVLGFKVELDDRQDAEEEQ